MSLRGVVSAIVLTACTLLIPSIAFAQASIAGVVRDSSGGVLPGVTVEAASPVLIEKVRTTVTDGNGRYQIVDLRPGAYSVTFILAGFSVVKRDGITLSGTSTATVDASLRVGALQETITVTGEAPLVDVSSTTRQQVLDAETIDALPTARNYLTLARLSPAAVGGGSDVGGSMLQDVGGSVTIHGSRTQDQRVTLNGINTMTLQAGGNIGGQIPDVGSAAEVTIEHTAVSAELPTGGVRINFIPRDGGNELSGTTFVTFSNGALQGSNFTEALRAAGLATPNEVKRNWDINPAFGGPILRDRVWFWFTTHFNGVENWAPVFENTNAWKPDEWLYVPDTSRRGLEKGRLYQSSLRVTWQATPRNKIAGTYKFDRWCNCPDEEMSATVSPEASYDRRFPRLTQEHLEWTSPVTNRFLLEAVGMHLFERWGNMHMRVDGGSLDDASQEAALPQMISVVEQTTGMRYRLDSDFNNTLVPNYAYRAAASYVTGTHNLKVGFNRTHGFVRARTYNFQPFQYRFRNGIPNRVTIWATPYTAESHLDNDLGLFAQDSIALNRFTIGLALRYDLFQSSFPDQTLGPGLLVPNRSLTFPGRDNLDWQDLTYRSALTYDLFGDGRTALKATANRYLRGQTLNALGSQPNPVNTHVNNTTRSWNDRNRNYMPDCDLIDPEANGECGPMANPNFGTSVPGATYDPDLLTGFGNREANWEFSGGIQHQLTQGLALDVGYFRRVWSSFEVVDDLALGPDDFDYFDLTVPSDPDLPGGGSYTLENVPAIKESAFGRGAQELHTLDRKYGSQSEHWNGVDLTLDARLQNGLRVSGGISTGKTTTDNCAVVTQLPEALEVNPAGPAGNAWQPASFCHSETPWLTQAKGYAVYTVPRVDVQLAGTFRNVPGAPVSPSFVATNAYLADNSTLGRPLAGGENSMNIRLFAHDTEYLDRRNELDFRIGKVLRVGDFRSVISLDLYNVFNSNVVLDANQNYGSWLAPTEILNARLAKISVEIDF